MRNSIIISKMLGYIDNILSYCEGVDYNGFVANRLLTEACIFNLSQLGELTTKLDPEFTARYPDIPWNQMRGLRNRIVHDYEGVNPVLVWEIISCDLTPLKTQLSKIK